MPAFFTSGRRDLLHILPEERKILRKNLYH
jgi:hypothetical protein